MAETIVLIGADVSSPTYKFEYSKGHFKSFSGASSSSLVGDELAIDRIEFVVNLDKYYRTVYAPVGHDAYSDTNDKLYAVKEDPATIAGALLAIPYATPVRLYHGGTLIGKFFTGDVERTGFSEVTIIASSALGVLENQKYLGNIFEGRAFSSVLSEIIGGAFTFTVDSALAAVQVYNWLPIDTKRNSIHQLLFAHGANITKDANGDMVFSYLQQTSAKAVPKDRVFTSGSSKYTPPATRVEVTEHTFFKLSTDTSIVLFDNTDGSAPAGNTFVAFQEAPVYGLSASSGLVINSSGVNYAVVSGVGVLSGKRYNHQTNVVGKDNTNASGVDKIVTSDGCTLVSVLNSSNVARRLMSYYSSPQSFSVDLDVRDEKPGDQLRFESPFREETTAFLAAVQYNITTFLRGRCDLVAGYEPTSPGGGDYSHVALLTSSGQWARPSGVTDATLVLISGGNGGGGGYDGTAGGSGGSVKSAAGTSAYSNGGAAGKGGSAGSAGSGGKVFQVKIDMTSISALSITIGAGGSGGARNGGSGGAGGNTTVTGTGISYSSASGAVLPSGYYDIIGQRFFGASGSAGIPGADGGAGIPGDPPTIGNSGNAASGAAGGKAGTGTTSASGGTYITYAKPTNNAYFNRSTSYRPAAISGHYISAGSGSLPDLSGSNVSVDKETGAWKLTGEYRSYDSGVTTSYLGTIEGGTLIVRRGVSNAVTTYRYSPEEVESTPGWQKVWSSGSGGGASPGVPGGDGQNQNGGAGASAKAPAAPTTPGSGGNGGNGGGGGGGGAGVRIVAKSTITATETATGGTGGEAGLGSAGSAGASGCVLIYY